MCKCKPDYEEGVTPIYCCEEHRTFSTLKQNREKVRGKKNVRANAGMLFDIVAWKCFACKAMETQQREKRSDRHNSVSLNLSNEKLQGLRKMLRVKRTGVNTVNSRVFGFQDLTSYQWALLWNICILNHFKQSHKYTKVECDDIARYLDIYITSELAKESSVDKVKLAIDVLHTHKQWLYENYHIPNTMCGIFFHLVLKDAGVSHYNFVYAQVPGRTDLANNISPRNPPRKRSSAGTIVQQPQVNPRRSVRLVQQTQVNPRSSDRIVQQRK
eukprot:g13775.t1